MLRILTLFKGMGFGAGLMYFLDPDKGRRRRAMFRDQGIHAIHELDHFVSKATRDLSNRVGGLASEMSSLFETEDVSDVVLAERVRSKLGRAVSQPQEIEVKALPGVVVLSGPVLASEVDCLLEAVASVRGVSAIESWLDVHQGTGDPPVRQSGRVRVSEHSQFWPGTWTPSTKLLAGMAGGLAALSFLRSGRMARLGLGALGVGLLAKSIAADQAGRHASDRTDHHAAAGSYIAEGMSRSGSGRPNEAATTG
jgi:BON domain